MYLQFYGLREAPFNATPDPKFLYQSIRHREALAQLMYGVNERKGFVVLTGEIGTGKTTLLRTLLARLDRNTHVAYVYNTALGIEGLLEYMLHDWNVKSTATSHTQRILELNDFLIEQHQQGLSPVLIIDEAQNLSIETLEAVRQLSNFETDSQKLMQIVLVGQPELRTKLDSHELRQLKQRIGLRFHIGPLEPEETRQYIRHRLRIAGATSTGIFYDNAIQRITEYSRGVPRVVNIVCDHCLLSGFADDKHRIDASVVEETIEYLEDNDQARWTPRRPLSFGTGQTSSVWVTRLGIAAFVALLLLLLVFAVNATGWFGHVIP
jgi:general secretion pathway protein A